MDGAPEELAGPSVVSLLLPPVSFNGTLPSLLLAWSLLSSGECRPFSVLLLGAGTGGCGASLLSPIGVLLAEDVVGDVGGNGAGRIGLLPFESDVDDGDGDIPILLLLLMVLLLLALAFSEATEPLNDRSNRRLALPSEVILRLSTLLLLALLPVLSLGSLLM